MTKVIILGHGGYGSAMKRNLAMLIGEHTTYYEQVMAGGVIAVLPLIVLFVIFQKQFVAGIAQSGIKG